MKFRDFSYMIGDEVILREQVTRVEIDGFRCTIEYTTSLPEVEYGYVLRTICVPTNEVELVIDAE